MPQSPFTGNSIRLTKISSCKYVDCSLENEKKEASAKCCWKLLIWGLLFVCAGSLIFIVEPNAIYRTSKFTLKKNGEMYGLWLKPRVKSYVKFYLFNVTNKEKFLSGQEKLRLKEVGPYIYRLRFEYDEEAFDEEEGTVTVQPRYSFEWEPDLNHHSESDTLVFFNAYMLVIASRASDKPYIFKMAFNELIRSTQSEPILMQTVKEFLNGTDNPITKFASTWLSLWINKNEFLSLMDTIVTSDGSFLTVSTGQKNFEQAGLLINVNGQSTLPHMEPPCNQLAGVSDGKKFGNNIKFNETLYVYHKSLCRTLSLVPANSPTSSNEWIPSVPYTFPDDMFDNGETNPENKCYCTNGRCLPSGLSDVSNCYHGFPVALSLPHFYKGHPSLMEKIDGLKPNKSRHETLVSFNQEIGIATKVHLSLQGNIVMNDVSDIYQCEKFSNFTLPLYWFSSEMDDIDSWMVFRIFLVLQIYPVAEKVFSLSFILVGVYLLLKVAQLYRLRTNS